MKTKIFGLFLIAITAALVFSGTAFAEGEVPLPDTTEVPQPNAAEEPTTPADQPALPVEPALAVVAAPTEEALLLEEQPIPTEPELVLPEEVTPVETEAPVVVEAADGNEEGSIAPTEPAVETPAIIAVDSSTPPGDSETIQPLDTLPEPPAAEITAPEVEVQVVDATGTPLDMASQQSALVLAGADPYFTSGIYTYRFSEVPGYCSTSPGSDDPAHCFDDNSSPAVVDAIQYAIDYISDHGTNPNDGLINVEWDTNKYEQDVSINASDFSVPSAIKGLIGKANATTGVFPTIKGNVSINGVTSGFTLSGFIIEGGVTISSVTGALNLTDLDVSNPVGNGISITNQKGNVTMTRVKSSNNNNYGASIDNTAAAGNVVISNSAFDDNGGPAMETGLDIYTNGTVTINGLSASRNYGNGLMIFYFSSLTIDNTVLKSNTDGSNGYGLIAYTAKTAPVILRNVIASNNKEDGLYIQTAGTILLNSVDTHYNFFSGINLNNGAGTGTVTLTNIRTSNNTYHGLYVEARGAITLTSVTAYQNHGSYGAYLDNCRDTGFGCTGTGSVTVTSPASAGIAGANSFWGNNNGYGLYIQSKGAVTVTNLNAYSNFYDGLIIQNNFGTAGITVNKNVPNWTNSFWGNKNRGININTKGSLTLGSCTAYDNAYEGIAINSAGAITLTDVEAFHNGLASTYSGLSIDKTTGPGGVTIRSTVSTDYMNFSGNTYLGISINSNGAVAISNVNAEGNAREGIKINTQGTAVISKSTASDNQWTGIDVTSKGAITLTDVEAFSNGLAAGGSEYSGLRLNNLAGPGAVTIKSSAASKYLDFSDNYNYGIAIYSIGAVSVSNVNVNDTLYKCGLFIDNRTGSTLTSPTVSISNSQFDLNNREGVYVVSDGSITLTNVSATNSKNNYAGVNLDNTTGASSGVTIKSSSSSVFYEFSKNTGSGIKISSKGPVSVSNVNAEGNGSNGIIIENYLAGSNLPVNVSSSRFNGNSQKGLSITSRGAITLTNVGASDNILDHGASLNNWMGGNTGVTIRSTSASTYYDFNGNGLSGIYIFSYGAVSVGNINANENGNYGLDIERNPGTGAISVTRGTFDHNSFDGLHIYTTPGGVTLTDVTASYNDLVGGTEYSGVYIEDGGTVVVKSSTTAAMYAFSHNIKHGLDIRSTGFVTISNVIAEGNRDTNIFIQNQAASITSPKPVSVTRSTANSSITGFGFSINTIGNVTLNTVTANGNPNGYGLYVNAGDGFCDTPASVTITGARNEFNGNSTNGIYIETEGNISLMNTIADENTGYGIYLNSNAYTDSLGNVTISASTNFWNSSSGNDDTGLHILTRGTVTISRLHTNENGNYGIMIDNDASSPLLKNVTLTSVDVNRNRGSHGLYISSLGTVALNSTRADSNEQRGMEIVTKGAVTFNGVSASFNSTHEADIPSANATIHERLTSDAEGDIWHFVGDNTISYTITLTSSDFDAYLKLFHWNTVSEEWDFITYDDNSGGGNTAQLSFPFGAGGLITGHKYYILATTPDNWSTLGEYELGFNGPGMSYSYLFNGAKIDNHTGTTNVTITSPASFWSSFSENNYTGLDIITSGTISLTNLDAANNGWIGINSGATGVKTGLTLRNTSTTRVSDISDNKSYGVYMTSLAGPVTISGRIWINDNGDDGLYLNNSAGTALMAVNLSSVTANNNDGYGIYVKSIGNITLSNLTANGAAAAHAGLYIDNGSISGSSVTISGSNLISDNLGRGLEVHTSGIVSITGVRAENNTGGEGIYVIAGGVGKGVTLRDITSQFNSLSGVYVDGDGAAIFTNVRSFLNGSGGNGDGIYVDVNDAYPIYFNTCTVIGNVGSGIDARSHLSWLHLSSNTIYFGNNTDNSLGDRDLHFF